MYGKGREPFCRAGEIFCRADEIFCPVFYMHMPVLLHRGAKEKQRLKQYAFRAVLRMEEWYELDGGFPEIRD